MAAHAMRYPPAPRRRRWPSRILGVLATAALLGTGAAIALMVMPTPEEEAAPAAPPTVEEASPAEVPLTAKQRAARRAAAATMTEQGFEPVRLGDWNPAHQLRVLIGRDEDGSERAFFFVKRRFVGNDDAVASASVRVVETRPKRVTLAYRLYRPDDQACCPKGERVKVAFRWEDGSLTPVGAVPPAAERVR